MPDRYIQVYDSPPPGKSIRLRDVDDQQAISPGNVATAKWSVERSDGTLVRMTTAELLANISTSALVLPTYAVRVEYPMNAPFIFEGALYRAKVQIPDTNTKTVAQLLADDEVEKIADGDGIPRSEIESIAETKAEERYTDEEKDEVAKLPDWGPIIARVGGFDIRDFRGGVPAPPAVNAPAAELDLAQKTIGIGNHGVNWTFELLTRGGIWAEFDNDKFEGALSNRLPGSAVADGDFYYLPNHGASPQHGIWIYISGLTESESEDVNTFLPNHRFLGNFTSQKAAENAITSYDSNITYLAFFPATISGRTGRIVQQLTSFTDVPSPTSKWIPSDEELHDLFNELENQLLNERDRIGNNISTIEDIRNEQRSQDTQIAIAQRSYPVTEFSDWTRDTSTSGTVQSGRYRATNTTLIIHHTDNNGDDQSATFANIFVNSAFAIGLHRFVIKAFESNSTFHTYTGYWEKRRGIDVTADNVAASIGYIDKDVRWGLFSEAGDIVGFEEEVEKHIGENRSLTRFETIEKLGQKGVPTKADFEGDYVLYMRGAHSDLQRATKIDINFSGIEVASDVTWQHDELLVTFAIDSTDADSLNSNLSGAATEVRVQISFYDSSDTFINRVDIDFGIGAAYATRQVLLTWNESRAYADLVLPADYTKYHELFLVAEGSGDTKGDTTIPVSALSANRSNLGGDTFARVNFVLSTRTITRTQTSGNNRLRSFVYAELR